MTGLGTGGLGTGGLAGSELFWLFGLVALVPLVALPLIVREMRRQERIARRMWEVQQGIGRASPAEKAVEARQQPLVGVLETLGSTLMRSGILSAATLDQLQETLANTALRGTKGLSIFVGIKVMLFLGLPVMAFSFGKSAGTAVTTLLPVVFGAAALGLLAPDFILGRIRKRYLKQVEAGLADALDLLVICAEAGLGLEPAIERVSEEIAVAHKAVAQELVRTSQDMRIIADRKVALTNMGTRTGLESLQRLSVTLVQSSVLGTPLAKTLRTVSAEMRQEALTRFEERAARLPVLLTLPMIIFILPCVFIVVGGPAALQVMRNILH